MIDAFCKWAETIEVSSLVTAPKDADAAPAAAVLPDETIREIKADQVELLYRMDRGSGLRPVVVFFVATGVVAGFESAMAWAAMGLYCAAWTWYQGLQRTFEKAAKRRENPEHWALQFTLATLSRGLAWGLGGAAWFQVSDFTHQALATVVVLGVIATSVITHALHRPATFAFVLTAVFPLALLLVTSGTSFGFMMTGFGILFVTSLLHSSKNLNRSQIDSIALQHQNEALVETVSEERRIAEKAKDAAEAGSRAKTEFLATMSHEVRTPLNGILGMAQILKNSDLNEKQTEQLDDIVESGEMLSTVLNDVLDLSKLEAGRLEIEPTPFNLQDAAESVVRLLRPGARHKGVKVEIAPGTAGKVYATGDTHRVRQVLLNLIGNAIKFTEEGEVNVTIAPAGAAQLPAGAGAGVPAGNVVVAIADTGIGIGAQFVPDLFKPFRQADQTTSRKYGGSGLGLAISKRLMDVMGGKIGVVTPQKTGSTFWFSLPAAEKPSKDSFTRGNENPTKDEAARPCFILLAEDNDLNAKVASALLGKAGHEVMRTHDGLETVEWMQDAVSNGGRLPDLILMDVRMPHLSGDEAAKTIRKMGGGVAQLPILALTADVSLSEFKDKGAALPDQYEGCFDGVLPKPITPGDLARAIGRFTCTTASPRTLKSA